MKINFIANRKIGYIFSTLLIVASVVSLSFWGLNLGIDFTGGSLLEVAFINERPTNDQLHQTLEPFNLGGVVIQPTGEQDVIFRFRDVSEDEHQSILSLLRENHGDIQSKRFESIGPTLGAELGKRALWVIGFALIFIILYIAWAFRKVAKPVASWKYGLSAIAALAHDVLITVGIFSVLGHYLNVEVDSLFVSAILTVLGFSVHDTIVVFDRTRENLFRGIIGSFDQVVNKSINDTLTRSINTSLTTLLVLAALFFYGGSTIHYFALALIVGIAIGTYSSIFIASPLLVEWYKLTDRH
ncbi:MAG: protein translocase subunit SecF [Patescibacteria group bacterium]